MSETPNETPIYDATAPEAPAPDAPAVDATASEALDNVPAIFRVPASRASLNQNRFQFQLPNEEQIRSLPKLKFLKPSIAVRIEEMPLQQAVIVLFETYDPTVLDAIEDLEQLEAIVEAWATASGIALGESKPS